uniref:Ig-like domain-containing protein n=1 Tax=Labrus bergylta TaxID=56723 RepID=A0A3Q3F1D8_9LABR
MCGGISILCQKATHFNLFPILQRHVLTIYLSQTIKMPQPISVTVVKPGDTVTLACLFTKDEAGLLNWYKMKFGFMVQTVAAGSFDKVILVEQFDNSRFTITKEGYLNFLIIRNVSKEDEATYFCQAGTAYEMKVINSTLLAVNDHKNHQNLVYVKQRPEAQSVQAGGSVKLQCSLLSKSKENREQCPGEHSVYWFRAAAGEAHPAVIYTQSHRSEEEEKRSCVYNLSKTIHNSSDAGTYYCAVLTCGQILFGEGTTVLTLKIELRYSETNSSMITCIVAVITSVFLDAVDEEGHDGHTDDQDSRQQTQNDGVFH